MNINKITIKLSSDKNTEQNFCPFKGEFINYKKNNKLEKFIIFMSEFQINLFTNVSEIFIDGTFKIVPKNWYQLLNIFGFDDKNKIYTPLAYILLSSKNEELYNIVFAELIRIIKNNTNIKSFEGVKIMTDFELSLRKSVKNNFEFCLLNGCYFHYCKSIWKKIKKLNLFKKNFRMNTLLVAFVMKAYPYIKDAKKEEYCNKILKYCENLGGNYVKLQKYFFKYWKNCEIFNFSNINDNTIKNRTNNICESFHNKINHKVGHYHPKLSYLVNQLKIITKEYYDKYIDNLSEIKNEKIKENFIANDIYEFIKKFVDKHNEIFNLDNLIQYLKEDSDNFYKLNISLLENVGDLDDNIIENLKFVFTEKGLLLSDINNEDNKLEECEEIDDSEVDNNLTNEINKIKSEDTKEKYDDFNYLLNGDVLLEEKLNRRKNKNKKTTRVCNMLDDLEI